MRADNPYNPDEWREQIKLPELQEPDPGRDEFFDPVRHDGGLALTLGIDHWRGEVHKASLIVNKCQIALDAYDYLVSVIGIDINDVFRASDDKAIIDYMRTLKTLIQKVAE